MQKHCNQLNENGFICSVVVLNKHGVVQTFGNKKFADFVVKHRNELEILAEPDLDSAKSEGVNGVIFPPLPKHPIEMPEYALRTIIPKVISAKRGDGYVGWGKPDRKPDWWPTDIPWTKNGVQKGIHKNDMARLVKLAYQSNNEPIPVSHKIQYTKDRCEIFDLN